MANLFANLPPVPPSLKSIAPYLQRAEELTTQDPIIAYWCAYYAAQIGITLKTRDAASRDLLLALLGALEQTKNEIGPNDAIHIEAVSVAYVENFALKVFANADNEDRSTHATRSTAKKFLAAANFLDILKTFQSDISESNEEKIRYAKWKAADIAKAFREGRRPVPGPPGWAEEQEELNRLQQLQQEQQQILSAPALPPRNSEFPLEPDATFAAATQSAPQDKPSSPSSNINFPHPHTSSLSLPNDTLRPYPGWGDHLSETWSTATPGISEPPNIDLNSTNFGWEEIPSSNATGLDAGEEKGAKACMESSSSSSGTVEQSTAWAGKKIEGQNSPISSMNALPEPDNTTGSQLTPQPHFGSATQYHGSSSNHASLSTSPSRVYNAFARQSPSAVYSHSRPPPPPVSIHEDAFELTPGMIGKAQKHCRFAISALDYEDAEQARKELRAALALIGG